jgi:zinc and cadmium transporter
LSILGGILMFFVVEKIIHWRHCHMPHDDHDHVHPFATMNLVGDAVHNFIDGIIIGISYIVSVPVGIATTIAVVLHEIPQEIADFGVLLHGGFSKKKALFFNFLTSLAAIVGAVLALVLGSKVEGIEEILVPMAAGGFIYIAGADLIPELHKEVDWKKSLMQIAVILFGFAVMASLLLLE